VPRRDYYHGLGDWSNGLIVAEDPTAHDVSKVLGGIGCIVPPCRRIGRAGSSAAGGGSAVQGSIVLQAGGELGISAAGAGNLTIVVIPAVEVAGGVAVESGFQDLAMRTGGGGDGPTDGVNAPNTGMPPKVQVKGNWGADAVQSDVEIRTGLYDAETGSLHVGGLEGHRGVARGAGIGDKPGTNISGLEIVKRGDGISFRDRSGWYPRALTPEEQANVGRALEAEFGMPAKYDPNLGTVARPGAPN
jgi:hypothetical protein